jgi:hypothetical protein
MLLNYKHQLVNAVKKVIPVYTENNTKPVNVTAETLTVKAGGAYL